jgi:DNA mismatch repair protein MutH
MTLPQGANASIDEILESAKRLKGKALVDLLPEGFHIDKRNKGSVGNLIERFGFGIENNSISGPDFIKEAIELKVLPLKRTSKGLIIKERTKICSINYRTLPQEVWHTSHAKFKLNKILFIFYIHSDDVRDAIIKDYFLYKIESDEKTLKDDWDKTVSYVSNGRAHLLSEGMANYLAPSRSGTGGLDESGVPKDLVPQYNDFEPRALKRAFSLKPTYTTSIFQERVLNKVFTPLSEIQFVGRVEEVVPFVIKKLNTFEGVKLSEFARLHGLELKEGKSRSAQLIRTALGLVGSHENVLEFNRLGIKFKTAPVATNTMMPFEAMSFPVVPFRQVIEEDFWESDIIGQMSEIIVIPLLRGNREDLGGDEIIGKAFFLRLEESELEMIEEEYESYRIFFKELEVRLRNEGKTNALQFWEREFIRSTQTKIIHMRPHTTKGNYDESIGNLEKVKHSFWFNKSFIKDKLILNK